MAPNDAAAGVAKHEGTGREATETGLTLVWVAGHRDGAMVLEFPHLCPGVDCAIARWFYQRLGEAEYYGLENEQGWRQTDRLRRRA